MHILIVRGSLSHSFFFQKTIEEVAQSCSTVISMLPNDAAVTGVSDILLKHSKPGKFKQNFIYARYLVIVTMSGMIHVGCSTVSPTTSRKLAAEYTSSGKTFVAAPVFARPDGLLKRQATWMVAGEETGRAVAAKLLESSGAVSVAVCYVRMAALCLIFSDELFQIVDYGDDTGSANVVKLCGNFLIASSIEAIGEAVAFSEKNVST